MKRTNQIVVRGGALILAAILASVFSAGAKRQIPNTPPEKRASSQGPVTNRVLEIRCYNLKPGVRDHFHQLVVQQGLPLLQRFNVDVVAYGPSLHDSDSYYLMRSWPSLEDRQKSEDSFYGSDDWRKGPRDSVLADIDNYTTVVIQVDDATLQGLRRIGPQ
jgi:hypothetical protein